jgi:hypothetical protein
LLLVLAAIANAFLKWRNLRNAGQNLQEGWSLADKKLSLFALIASHLQLTFGLVLYFVSPKVQVAFQNFGGAMKDANLRYFAVEHLSLMIIGIVLITIGYSKGKRSTDTVQALKNVWLWYGIGLILILSRVPFPGMYGTGWF